MAQKGKPTKKEFRVLLNGPLRDLNMTAWEYLEKDMKDSFASAIKSGDYQKVVDILLEAFSRLYKKGGNRGMEGVSWIYGLLVIAVAIVVFLLLKNKGVKAEPDTRVSQIISGNGGKVKATDRDRDFLELIHLLAVASDKTDAYLKE